MDGFQAAKLSWIAWRLAGKFRPLMFQDMIVQVGLFMGENKFASRETSLEK